MKTRLSPPVITLLTDFGLSDHYAAAMKGVILGICLEARLVDISHEVTPYAITEAAYTLAQAWRCFPPGTIHLIVVDPGVGSPRRPIVVEAAGHYFVAPDNGVLSMLYDTVPVHSVREITASGFFCQPVSRTFHGRDIFAPTAAHLATGVDPAEFGQIIEDYQYSDFARPVADGPDMWTGTILKVDRFGNLITNFESSDWERLAGERFEIRVGSRSVMRMAGIYAAMEGDELFLIAGSAECRLSGNLPKPGERRSIGGNRTGRGNSPGAIARTT
jgi:S-adenosylmethionine hydrolase